MISFGSQLQRSVSQLKIFGIQLRNPIHDDNWLIYDEQKKLKKNYLYFYKPKII